MVRNYLKLTVRNLWKNKLLSSINLLGLTLGIGCSLLLLMYVRYEHSYDDFMKDGDRIYRLVGQETDANGRKIGLSGEWDYDDLSNNYAGLSETVKLRNTGFNMFTGNDQDKMINVQSVFASDNFFDFFGFPLIEGNSEDVLSDPSSIVLTRKTAEKFFGTEDPIGQVITLASATFNPFTKDLVVTGIAEETENSHIQFEAIIPWDMTTADGLKVAHTWFQRSLFNYVKTTEGAAIADVAAKKNEVLRANGNDDFEYYFQPLSDIYLGSNDIQFLPFEAGNIQTVQTLFYIAIVILLVASINYVNLQTAKGTQRALEVGVRKVMGAQKGQLITQFLAEAFVLSMLAAVAAVLLIDISLPAFNNLTGKSFTIDSLFAQGLFPNLMLIMFLTALFSGVYPAFILSSFNPARVLKSSSAANLTGKGRRRVLILVQFGISIFLIALTAITFQQTDFINKKDLGFNKDQVINFSLSTKNLKNNAAEAFRAELDQYDGIVSTSMSTDILGTGYTNNSGHVYLNRNPETKTTATIFGVDHRFIETYDLKLITGRDFDEKLATESGALIINEAMVSALNLEDPLNANLALFRSENEGRPIIGVVKDFHFQKLHQKVNPVALRISTRNLWNMSVQMSSVDIPGTLEYIENKWAEFEPEEAIKYNFVDQQFARFYDNEMRMLKAVTFFSLISIILTALGLFGMTTFVIARKLKEIGIRKVLGAKLSNIHFLIFKEFIIMLLLAIAISAPAAYLMGKEWLNRFAYRIEVTALPFSIAILITFIVIFTTVTTLSFKASKSNPVDALRNE